LKEKDMRKKGWIRSMAAATLLLFLVGCEGLVGPDLSGKIKLSSQLFGSESYYLFGYSYEDGEFYKYPYTGERVPDIINEGFLVIEGSKQTSLPGFNTPGMVNGFALVGEFESLGDARGFYEGYDQVEEGLQFETVSDTVELYQVWVHQTSAGNYVKMVVTSILDFEVESGRPYNEVTLEYVYSPEGSTDFPDTGD
jgi:hypothetical protein